MTAAASFAPLTGHCTCKTITYTILAPPLVTNCCHCTWCQRETGSAFAINSIVETSNFNVTSCTPPVIVDTPSASGKGQAIARCPDCFVAIFSYYPGTGIGTMSVRASTLAEGSKQRISPDVHIFTASKVQWLDLSREKERGIPVCEEYYAKEDLWREASLKRWKALLAKARQAEASTN